MPSLDVEYCNNCDIMLGGLVPVHTKSTSESKFGKCGPDFNDWAMPRVEAMLFAVDEINRNPNLLPNHTLGIHILDTCGIETIATERAKRFLQDKCNAGSNLDNIKGKRRRYFAGVIGEMYSSVSKTVATFLQPWKIPQVSPASTSVDLSDQIRYKYFARTVPSDRFQNRVVVDILKELNWTLISTIVSAGSFTEEIGQFNKLAEKNGICNSVHETIPKNPTFPDDFERTICTIFYEANTNAVVLFTNVEDTSRILNATRLLAEKRGKIKHE